MLYLAIDPGVVTGVAIWTPDMDLKTRECDHLQEVIGLVKFEMGKIEPCLPIVERFLISERTLKTKIYYESIHFEGWITLEYPGTVQQTPAQAKGFATDEMLKHMGWYTKTEDGHANDAARHLLYRAVKNREPYVIDRLKEFL